MTLEPSANSGLTIYGDTTADMTTWMTERSAAKLKMLRQKISDLHAVVPLFEERKTANEERFEAENRLRRLQAHPHENGFSLPDSDQRVIDQKRNVERLTAEAKRVADIYEARSAAWTSAGQALANVEAWLRDGRPRGTALEDFSAPEPKLAKGEASIVDAIENRRRRVRELKSDIARINAAPFPSSYAKQKMREQMSVLAERGAPSASALVERDGAVEFNSERHSVPVIAGNRENPVSAVVAWQQPDVLALFAWMFERQIVERLDAEIASEADDKNALSHAERQRQEAEVMRDLLATERDEGFFVWKAQAERLPVEHRADINPLALLDVQLVTAPKIDQSAGSSPQHAYDIVGGRRR